MNGLCAGAIVHKTLVALGLPSSCIDVHLLGKGATIYDEVERLAMEEKEPKYIIFLGHVNPREQPLIDSAGTKTLIIDNHWTPGCPENAMVPATPKVS